MRTWKKNEIAMYENIVGAVSVLDGLAMAKEKFSRYDCFNEKVVVELKVRTDAYGPSKYPTTMIEWDKYKALTEMVGKIAIYAVQAEGKIYLFNLSRLTKEDYNFEWSHTSCNTTTHFSNTSKKQKHVGYIEWDKAKVIINVE